MALNITWLDLNASYSHASLALPAIEAQSARFGIDSIKKELSGLPDLHWCKVSGTLKSNINELVAEVIETRPHILCATLWLFNHQIVLQVLSRLKILMPEVTIALGGPEFQGDNETFLRRNDYIQTVLRGEGEEVFYDWVKTFKQGVPDVRLWKNITGLCYLQEGKYQDQGMARVAQFDALVPPETSEFFPWDKPFVQLETTRGCFNTCKFCVSGTDKPVRNLSVEQIRLRLDRMAQKGVRNVRVLDRTFNGNETRSIEILQLFEQNYPGIQFHLEIHPALLSSAIRNQLRKMSSGKLHLEAGLQSLQDEVIQRSGRKGNCKEAIDGIRFLQSLTQCQTHTDLIAGLPAYTYAAVISDVNTLIGIGVAEIQMESLKLLPGTPFREHASEYGLCYSQLPPYEVLQTDVLSLNELNRLLQISRILDDYYNTDTWREVIRTLLEADSDFLEHFLDWLIARQAHDALCSIEKKGELLYQYCIEEQSNFLAYVAYNWIQHGFSLKKKPAEKLIKYQGDNPQLNYYALEDVSRNCVYVFGFDKMRKKVAPHYVKTHAGLSH